MGQYEAVCQGCRYNDDGSKWSLGISDPNYFHGVMHPLKRWEATSDTVIDNTLSDPTWPCLPCLELGESSVSETTSYHRLSLDGTLFRQPR